MELLPQSSVQSFMFAHVLIMGTAFKKKKIARKTMPTTQKDSVFSRVRARMVTPDPFVIQILTLVKKILSHVTQASPVLIYHHLQTKLVSSANRVQVVSQEMVLIVQVYHNYRLLTRQNGSRPIPNHLVLRLDQQRNPKRSRWAVLSRSGGQSEQTISFKLLAAYTVI